MFMGHSSNANHRLLSALVLLMMFPGVLITVRHTHSWHSGTPESLHRMEFKELLVQNEHTLVALPQTSSARTDRYMVQLQIENALNGLHQCDKSQTKTTDCFTLEIEYLQNRIHQVQADLLAFVQRRANVRSFRNEMKLQVGEERRQSLPPVGFLKTHKVCSTCCTAWRGQIDAVPLCYMKAIEQEVDYFCRSLKWFRLSKRLETSTKCFCALMNLDGVNYSCCTPVSHRCSAQYDNCIPRYCWGNT